MGMYEISRFARLGLSVREESHGGMGQRQSMSQTPALPLSEHCLAAVWLP